MFYGDNKYFILSANISRVANKIKTFTRLCISTLHLRMNFGEKVSFQDFYRSFHNEIFWDRGLKIWQKSHYERGFTVRHMQNFWKLYFWRFQNSWFLFLPMPSRKRGKSFFFSPRRFTPFRLAKNEVSKPRESMLKKRFSHEFYPKLSIYFAW